MKTSPLPLLDRSQSADAPPPPPTSAARRVAAAVAGPVARKGVLSVLDQAVVSGTSFLTSVVIGRLCSREELGVYALGLSIVLFIRGVQGELVCTPYTIYCQRRKGQALAEYTGNALAQYLLLTACSVLALAGLVGVFALGSGPATVGPAVWVLGSLPFLLLREFLRQLSFAHLRLRTVLAIDVCVAVLQIGGLLLLGHFRLLNVGRVYGMAGAACAVAGLGWLLARPQPWRLAPARLGADWWHNWSFARWSLASYLLGNTTSLITPWIVVMVHGEAETGVLAACVTLINCAGMYVIGVDNLLTPQAARAFARGGWDALRQVLWKTAVLFGVTLGPFCVLILATGDLSATLVYGGKYAGAGAVLGVLAVNVLINSLGVVAGDGLWAMERPRANFAADVSKFAVTIGAMVALVGPLGVLGAAAATLTGTSVGVGVRCVRLVGVSKALRSRK